jgi:hypothetical protein
MTLTGGTGLFWFRQPRTVLSPATTFAAKPTLVQGAQKRSRTPSPRHFQCRVDQTGELTALLRQLLPFRRCHRDPPLFAAIGRDPARFS